MDNETWKQEMKQSIRKILMNYTVKALKSELRKKELLPDGDKATLVSRLTEPYLLNAAEYFVIIILTKSLEELAHQKDSLEKELKSMEKELKSMEKHLNTIKRKKESLEQQLKTEKYKSMQRRSNSTSSSSEVQSPSLRVTSSTSRDAHEHREIRHNRSPNYQERYYERENYERENYERNYRMSEQERY